MIGTSSAVGWTRWTSLKASIRCAYAPQRQMLPLIRSLISASDRLQRPRSLPHVRSDEAGVAVLSPPSSNATIEQSWPGVQNPHWKASC